MNLRGSLLPVALLAGAVLTVSLLPPHVADTGAAGGAGTSAATALADAAAASAASAGAVSAGSSAALARGVSSSGSTSPTPAATSAFPSASSASASSASASSASSAALSSWRGGVDLYRAGVFTTQKTWYWCTAATVQISRNIVYHRTDHSAASQRAYFDWMRQHDRYRLPLSAGVDAAGWAAGFAHFVDPRYRLRASASFDAALRSAVTRLRTTNLPVAIAVDHGNHAWLLTGFTATADPAQTSRFAVTSVRVVGPLYGLQSRNGYDMPPDTRLTPTQLRHFFTPWHYAPIPMVWDGTYVSIQP